MEANRVDAWNVRPMPSAAMSDGAQRRSECPFNRMSPRTGRYSLLRQLNSVVLPAPLGPIKPDDPTLGDGEGDVIKRDDAAEVHRHAGYLQQRRETAPLPDRCACGGISVMPLDAPSSDFLLRDPAVLIFLRLCLPPSDRAPAECRTEGTG